MANRQPNRPPPASQVPSSARQNEYFVPRDGIDREVITSDICRYLGNDALVRPGTYEAADGRVTQGYFITAYRNLTSAMIQDLKADSARWEQERRAASRTSGGGTGGTMHSPSQPNGMFMRGSNSPIGSREPRSGQPDYVSWKNSQDAYRGGGDRMDVEYSAQPPVTQPGYGGAPYGGAPPPPHGYPSQAPYPPPGQSGSAPPYGQPYGYPPNPSQYSPGPHPGAAPAPPPISQVAPVGYPQDPGYYPGGNFSAAGGYPVQPSRMTPLSSAPPTRGFGVTAGPGYSEPDAFGYGGSAPMPFSSLQNSIDPVYGRAPGGAYNTTTTNPPQVPSDDLGSPAGTAPPRQGYSAGPEPPFDDRQSPIPNASTPTNGTPSQIPPTGPPPARRDTDMRDRDRDIRDHRTRRPDEDRHAAERERARRRQH